MRINRQLSPGDTLVVATDGVWDNLHKKNVEYIVANSATMEEAAEFISLQSYRQSSLTDFKSPFYEKAISSGQTCTPSGKPDDITVITARVVQTPAF
jgi:serine/threonine protein phosphatase PrpC